MDYAGNVGIGTATPSATLDAETTNGNLNPAFVLKWPGTGNSGYTTGLQITSTSGTAYYPNMIGFTDTAYGSSAGISMTGDNGLQFLASSNAVFGFGDTTDDTVGTFSTRFGEPALLVGNSSSIANKVGLAVKDSPIQAANLQEWQNASGAAMAVVDANGNVGIGTTSPVYPLDVNGDINIAAGSALLYNGVVFSQASTTLADFFTGGAGNSTMTGTGNTGNGAEALSTNIDGNNNVANGGWPLISMPPDPITRDNGFQALSSNDTGSFNTANGANALLSNTSGIDNVANGMSALLNNTSGNENVANGSFALSANTTGEYNTAIGNFAGASAITGCRNTYIGNGADATGYALNSTALGYDAQVTQSNQVVIGNSSVTQTLFNGNVGIGTKSTPVALLT